MTLDPKNNIGESVMFFIPIGEEQEFWDRIAQAGFEKNGKGVYNYIQSFEPDFEDDEDDEDDEDEGPLFNTSSGIFGNLVGEWMKRNPQEVERIRKKTGETIAGLYERLKKKA